MKIRFAHSVFIRNYDKYTYLFNKQNGFEQLFENQSFFFGLLSYNFIDFEEIINKLFDYYNHEVPKTVLNSDYLELLRSLCDSNILEIDSDNNNYTSTRNDNFTDNIHANYNVRKYLRNELFIKKPIPVSIHIDIISKCNEHCLHCYLPTRNQELKFEQIISVLNIFSQMGGCHVTFSGGECFLHPHINDILIYANSLNLVIHIMSNLTHITEKHLEIIEKIRPFVIQTTLFSMDCDIHDSIARLKGAFKATLDNITKIQKLNIPVSINCPVLKYNYKSILEVWDFALRNHFEFNLAYHIMKNFGSGNQNPNYRLSLKEFDDFIQMIAYKAPERLSFIRNSIDEEVNNQMEDCCCGAGIDVLAVGADGMFYPCSSLQQFPIDSIDIPLNKVWSESSKLQMLRSIRRSSIQPCSLCCQQKCSICMGRNLSETGSLTNVGDYFCSINKIIKKYCEALQSDNK